MQNLSFRESVDEWLDGQLNFAGAKHTMVENQASDSLPIDLFFKAAFSVDLALFTFHEDRVKILLNRKQDENFWGQYGLPGKLVPPNGDTDAAINSLGVSAIGTHDFYRKQLRAFSEVGRHPEGRVITIAYYGLIPAEEVEFAEGGSEKWFDIDDLPELSYDHDKIVEVAKRRLQKGLLRHPTVFEMLPEEFILREVIQIYEQIFDTLVDHPNFRRQLRDSGLLIPKGELRVVKGRMGRRPQVFAFDRVGYAGRKKEVIGFPNLQ